MGLDLNADYKSIQDKIKATQAYKQSKSDYEKAKKVAGDSFEQAKSEVSEQINNFKEQKKAFEKQVKNQFEQLLDINNITGGKGSNSARYIKRLLLKAMKNIEPKVIEILLQESINALGCDQQQIYNPQFLYIKVSSVDFGQLLKKDPNSAIGKVLYEKIPIQVQIYPFSMNRELYQRTQSGQPYSIDNGQLYLGASGQPLFDIQYVELDNLGQTGPWFKITLQNRVSGVNKVGEFLVDYYKTIRVFDFQNVIAQIMESLSGCISIEGNIGLVQAEDATKFMLILQRIFGLCFDTTREIDVSGQAKVSDSDGIDESFFEFTEIDLRNIDQRIANIKKGVIQFEDCNNVDLPVNSQSLLESLNNLNFVSDNDLEDAADQVTDTLADNPDLAGLALSINVKVSVDFNFVKLLVQGLILALFTPKILLPIMTMFKALGQNASNAIDSYMAFIKLFSKYVINVTSKIQALFVQELFELIKRDIVNLIQAVVKDLAKEKADKRIIMILKLIQILIIVSRFIRDWRRCKSVIDELLQLLNVVVSGWGGEVPLPLLFGSQLLDGYSESRAFLGTIEELQKIGVPTGPMPDGSPNLDLLSKFSLLKAHAKEEAENGKVQVAIGPLTMTPAGLTVPASSFGKKL
jgi:hypothetical protein